VALAVALVIGAGLAFVPDVLNDGDTFLHIRAGEAMLDTGSILTFDPFSASKAGAPWQTHEWLAQLALGLAHRVGGLSGVLVLTALAGGLALYQTTRAVTRHVEPAYAVLMLAIGVLVAAPSLLARPHVLVLPLLAAVLVEVFAAAEAGRRPRLLIVVPAIWLWANMHGSFVVGLALIGVGGLEAMLAAGGWRPALDTAARWALVGVVATAATVAGPHGLATLTFPLTHSSSPVLAQIGEWAPLTFSRPNAFEAALALILVLLSRRVTLSPARLIALLALMYLSVTHVRHLLLLGVIAPVLLAPTLGALKPATGGAGGQRPLAVLVMAALAIAGARLGLPASPRDAETTPVSAVAAVPDDLKRQPVFNDYAFGAYLIYADVPPLIDSRVELYGTAFIRDYSRSIYDVCRLVAVLNAERVAWTILTPQNPATAMLDRLPGWTRIHADAFAVVHRHDGGETPAPERCAAP
jgi:MFS family permease